MKRFAAAAIALTIAGAALADVTTLKIGTLAPPDSPWGQVFKVWKRAVSERSSGAIDLQFFWNGQQGDDASGGAVHCACLPLAHAR